MTAPALTPAELQRLLAMLRRARRASRDLAPADRTPTATTTTK